MMDYQLLKNPALSDIPYIGFSYFDRVYLDRSVVIIYRYCLSTRFIFLVNILFNIILIV